MSRINLPRVTSLADRFRRARDVAGLRKVDIARKTGLSLSYVGRIENAKSKPSRLALEALARVLDVDPLWLASGEGEITPRRTGDSERVSPHKKERWTCEADLRLYLSGTTLENAFRQVSPSVRRQWETSWRAIPETQRASIRRTIRTLGISALLIDQLPKELSKSIRGYLSKQLLGYLTSTLRAYLVSHET